ncbi:insulinase family protein [Candidatus Sumerlaeota bacterium]|nr:pitrilysin family protein [Candidatus Sumerlaeales bacterium]NLD61588.1 insulinase family protein [Candidatus Sumerlaeota bacterium]
MRIHSLDNGLKTVIERTENSVVTIDCWVGTGSAEETPQEFGIAHFLEHMMFKGTERFGVNGLDAVVTGLGGEWNAGTSKDWTHYHLTVPAEHFAKAADIIADMMQNAKLDPEEFAKERSVILEEILRKNDSPTGSMFERIYDCVYDNSGYKHPTLGTQETVSAMTSDMMRDFYRRFYTPDNTLVVIAGDVDHDEALRVITDFFGGWQGKRPSRNADNTRFATEDAETEIRMDVTENYQALAWPAPSVHEQKKVLALDIASDILSGGRGARLDQRLKEELGLVGNVSCGSATHYEPSFFYLYTVHEPHNENAAKLEALKMLNEFADNGPTPEELKRSRRKLRNDLYFSMEETEDITSTLGYWYTLTGSTDIVEHYEALINELNADDIKNVIAEILEHQYTTVSIRSLA